MSHHQSKPSRADRSEFPRKVIQKLMERAGGRCEVCRQRPDTESHHIQSRARGGRGVFGNGLRVCNECHRLIQTNEDELQYWVSEWERRYGPNFWFDAQDCEEHGRRKAAEQEAEQAKRQRINALQPIVSLLSTAAGRKLNSKEIRLISAMDERETEVFAKLMRDVVSSDPVQQS